MSSNEHDLKMPSFGSDMRKGTLTQWLVKEGDHIKRGDVVAVIETHKGAIDLDLFEDALIINLLVKEGDQIAVGEPIARLSSIKDSEKTTPRPENVTADPMLATAAANINPSPAPTVTEQPDHHLTTPKDFILATPAARSFAKQQQLTLNLLFPKPVNKIVTLTMVEQAIQQKQRSQQSPATAENAPDKKETAKLTLSRAAAKPKKVFDNEAMRQAISATVTRSKQQIPHYYLRQRLDITALEDYLLQVNARLPIDQRLLLAAPLLCAVARALMDNGQLNGEYSEGRFVASETVHLANAINLRGGGLVMPVIRAAQTLSPSQVMELLKQQVTRARNGSLVFSELSGGSFTVTSIGERGAEQMFAVIFPPQVAILALGSPHQEVMAVDGSIKIRSVIEASLAADHRVSDGRIGARFLYQLNQLLQKPEALWTASDSSGVT
ncbi:MAG: pyruvate dehydrogenase E2 component (dihydrolipoamide acetyltransferase) [Psychromonas sp.]|jgi:pyruvate dehydrogenase E2 component (dihydrolipoamide acetyltransferase)|uniref:dihydrolipoamide acetyltransferase family protein n=1 Tax=Psychromonas sp. TaxID=1884585 RepID=UPI0039E392F0